MATMSPQEVRRRINAAMSGDSPAFSVQRLLREQITHQGLSERGSVEGEIASETARAHGWAYDQHAPPIPLSLLQSRDLTVASGAGGGYLAPSDAGTAWQPLYGHSVVLGAGVTVINGQQASVSVPRITADPTTTWLSTEGTAATEGNVTFGTVALSPKTCGAYIEVSRQLIMQAANVDYVLGTILLRAASQALDVAVLTGSGSAGQPLGLVNTSSIQTASGTALSWATMLTMRTAIEAAAGQDRNITWLGGSTTKKLLAAREKISTSGNLIWANHQIDGDAAAVTKGSPADSLFIGDWSQCVVCLFGPALKVEIDPTANFKAGIVGMRVMLSADVAFMNASTFGAISSVT